MIHYLIGSAMKPILKPALLPHIVNDIGLWGSGYVLAVSAVNPNPEAAYLKWFAEKQKTGELLPLGNTQIVPIDNEVSVCNMVAQHGVRSIDGAPPIRYEALEQCLIFVNLVAVASKRTIHMPRIGAVRSGGDWTTIEALIREISKVETYIYTLETEKDMWNTIYENI
jgi:hypothetical protein